MATDEPTEFPVNSTTAVVWPCSSCSFQSGAVTGLSRVFFANLYKDGFSLRRLPVEFFGCLETEQSQVLRDRIALADEFGRLMRRKKDKFSSNIRVGRSWWSHFKRESAKEGSVPVVASREWRSRPRPLANNAGDVYRKVPLMFERLTIGPGFPGELRARDVRIGRDQLATTGSRAAITRLHANGDAIHSMKQLNLKYCLSTSELKFTVTSAMLILRPAARAGEGAEDDLLPDDTSAASADNVDDIDYSEMLRMSFKHGGAWVTVTSVNTTTQPETATLLAGGVETVASAAQVWPDFFAHHLT